MSSSLIWQYQDFRIFIKEDSKNSFQVIQEKKNELGLKGWEIYDVHRAKPNGKPELLYLIMAKRQVSWTRPTTQPTTPSITNMVISR